MKIPKIEWKKWDKNNPDDNGSIGPQIDYLVLIEDDDWDRKPLNYNENHLYHIDVAESYGSYIDDFWNTRNDWVEGNRCSVLAYAEIPSCDYAGLIDFE